MNSELPVSPWARLTSNPLMSFPLAGAVSGLISYAVVEIQPAAIRGVGSVVFNSLGLVPGILVALLLYLKHIRTDGWLLACVLSCFFGWYLAVQLTEYSDTSLHIGLIGSPIGAAISYIGVALAIPAARKLIFLLAAILGCTASGILFDLVTPFMGDAGWVVLLVSWQAVFFLVVALTVKAQTEPQCAGAS